MAWVVNLLDIRKTSSKVWLPMKNSMTLRRVWSGGDGKEEPLLIRQKEEFQFLSMSAPETWFLNLFHQETGPWHCTKRLISPYSTHRLFARGEYILYFECINLNLRKWDCLEHQQSQGSQEFYLKSKENESGGLFPNILDLPLLWEISRHEDFFSVLVCFSCLNPASPTPQLWVCPWLKPEWTQNLSQKLTLEMLNWVSHLNPQAVKREKWEWEGKRG